MKIALNKDLIISALREDERTPTVCLLLQLIENQTHLIENQTHLTEVQHAALCELQAKLIELDEEIKRLKGLKGRPKISPSTLDKPPSDGSGSGTSQDSTGQGNSGSGNKGKKNKNHKNRQKTSQLTIHEEKHLTPDNLPEGSRFKGTKPYVVQDLRLTPWTTKYLREKWQLPDGRVVTAPLSWGSFWFSFWRSPPSFYVLSIPPSTCDSIPSFRTAQGLWNRYFCGSVEQLIGQEERRFSS
jgi:hypothetical protein